MLKNLFVYFLLLYFYAFFLIRKGKHNQEMKKKPLHLLVKLFFFFFFPKIISYHESSARKNKNASFSGHVIPAKSDPSNHFSRIKKKYLRSAMRVRAVIVEAHASSTGWVSSSLSNQERTENSLSKFMWAWNWCSLADYGYGNF